MVQRILGLIDLDIVQRSSCIKRFSFCSRMLMKRYGMGNVSASGSELLGYVRCLKEGFWGFNMGFVVDKVSKDGEMAKKRVFLGTSGVV
jgi:hypothetical protein